MTNLATLPQRLRPQKKKYKEGNRNFDIEKDIKTCITKQRLSSLAILTTSAGAYTLGIIGLALAAPGVNFVASGALAISGIIIMAISELGVLGNENKLSTDVKKLITCLFP